MIYGGVDRSFGGKGFHMQMSPAPTAGMVLPVYRLIIILIWGAFLIYKFNDYYREFIMAETKTAILYLTLSYTILALPFYLNDCLDEYLNLLYGSVKIC